MSDRETKEAVQAAVDWKDIANPAAPVDLVAENGRPCRRIRPLADGTLVCKNRNGESISIVVTKNVDEDIQATTIEAATDIDVRVYW